MLDKEAVELVSLEEINCLSTVPDTLYFLLADGRLYYPEFRQYKYARNIDGRLKIFDYMVFFNSFLHL